MTAPVQEGHPTGVEPIVRDSFYIGGEWVPADGRETLDVIDATTEEVVGTIALGTSDDVEAPRRSLRWSRARSACRWRCRA